MPHPTEGESWLAAIVVVTATALRRRCPRRSRRQDRDGAIVPYFKTGNYRWTDGGLQSDLPKQRLTELFNVNQFIVSQVNQPLHWGLVDWGLVHWDWLIGGWFIGDRLIGDWLFGTDQSVVSQVNPLAPFFVPVQSGMPLLEQAFWLLKHQLVSVCRRKRGGKQRRGEHGGRGFLTALPEPPRPMQHR